MSNNTHQAGYKQHVIQRSAQTGHRQAERDTKLKELPNTSLAGKKDFSERNEAFSIKSIIVKLPGNTQPSQK